MKHSVRCLSLAGTAGVMGFAAALIRSRYFEKALEKGGFLTPGHPLQILFWILAAVMLMTAGVLSFHQKTPLKTAPKGILPGVSELVLSLSLGLTALWMPREIHFYEVLRLLGLAAAAGLLANGVLLMGRKTLGIFPNSLLCLFFLLYSVGMYSQWSNVPEMERILVPAVALILMLPLSCELAAWDAGEGKESRILFLAGMALFFNLASLGCPTGQNLNLGGAVWALGAIVCLLKEGEKK